jgi:5-methyltetrahydrofolate--homocysteine methyltransferase
VIEGSRLAAALARGPVLLDAAMGTRLIARGLDLRDDDPALWNLSHPDEVLDIHRRDLAAGSDGVVTNTFGANRRWLGRYGRAGEIVAVNRRAVALAREAAGPDRLVIGSIGPTVGHEERGLCEQLDALIGAGVDAILFETFAHAGATYPLRRAVAVDASPILLSLSRWPPLDGPTALWEATNHGPTFGSGDGVTAFGSNCLLGMSPTCLVTERIHPHADVPLIAKPSAGLPDGSPESPETFAESVPRLLALGVRLFGGCCGTTETHVAALRGALNRVDPGPASATA